MNATVSSQLSPGISSPSDSPLVRTVPEVCTGGYSPSLAGAALPGLKRPLSSGPRQVGSTKKAKGLEGEIQRMQQAAVAANEQLPFVPDVGTPGLRSGQRTSPLLVNASQRRPEAARPREAEDDVGIILELEDREPQGTPKQHRIGAAMPYLDSCGTSLGPQEARCPYRSSLSLKLSLGLQEAATQECMRRECGPHHAAVHCTEGAAAGVPEVHYQRALLALQQQAERARRLEQLTMHLAEELCGTRAQLQEALRATLVLSERFHMGAAAAGRGGPAAVIVGLGLEESQGSAGERDGARALRGEELSSAESAAAAASLSRDLDMDRVAAVALACEDQLCQICRERAAATVVLPCRHLALCRDCAPEAMECPRCTTMVQGVLHLAQ